jgi:hypothetical protein
MAGAKLGGRPQGRRCSDETFDGGVFLIWEFSRDLEYRGSDACTLSLRLDERLRVELSFGELTAVISSFFTEDVADETFELMVSGAMSLMVVVGIALPLSLLASLLLKVGF